MSFLIFVLASPTSVWAHASMEQGAGFSTGFHHPLSGWDHLLVMLAVGIWAAQKRGREVWMLPLSFVGVMIVGGLVGATGVSVPGVEIMIVLSVIVFGAVVVRRVRLRTSFSVLLVGFFAFFHGFAHGHEMPASASLLSFALGFVAATLLLHSAGILTVRGGIIAMSCLFGGTALAQDAVTPQTAETERITVVGREDDLIGYATTSSEGVIGAAELADRPLLRRGELLEAVPGVIITQHSGEAKANQYYLRGFNLDHGTDFALSVDDMPINMRTHAHGQGYADTNFIIPELVRGIDYSKGPFFAEVGDFSSAGAAKFILLPELPNGIATISIGENNFYRLVLADSVKTKQGTLTAAFEYGHYDGPYVVNQNAIRYNGFLRWNWGDRENQFSLTGMAYHGHAHSPDQVPQRAIDSGLIDRLGAIDTTDALTTDRESLSFDWTHSDSGGAGTTHLNAYAIYYHLDIFSDFTYFLDDPVHGDQFEQFDRRFILGGSLTHTWETEIFGRKVTETIGLQTRNDFIPQVSLYKTQKKNRLSTVRDDSVEETSVSLYQRNEIKWTPWFRSVFGLRGDLYYFHVDSDTSVNSGEVIDGIVSPKLNLVFGPWAKTEFYLNAGTGLHSNDARGTTITVSPSSGEKVDHAPPLVRSKSVEIGARTSLVPNLVSTVSLYYLNLDSELVFSGDAGDTAPSAASRRIGVEFANYYKPTKWLTLDADFAYTNARFENNPAGDRIPGSIATVFAAGATVNGPAGFFSTLRTRYFGPQPLIEDNSAIAKSSLTFDGRVGWSFRNVQLTVDVLNIFDKKNTDVSYFYTSRLPGEASEGVDDFHVHPAEPRTVRFSATYKF
ncbi:MAG: HupE/UreJ family protein [Verrucomicrobiota bacterium]|nr:HupE/UreJ family protein [Verrucomicrobiota bacterium]